VGKRTGREVLLLRKTRRAELDGMFIFVSLLRCFRSHQYQGLDFRDGNPSLFGLRDWRRDHGEFMRKMERFTGGH